MQYSNIKITFQRHRMSQIQKNTVLYELQVQTRQAKWYLSKKYDEFSQLHENLSKYHHNLPEFPLKSILSLSYFLPSDDQQKSRSAKLQCYSQALTIRLDIINSDYFREFFQLDKNSPGLLCLTPKLLGEFSVDPQNNDVSKGVRDFFFDEQMKTFLITTGDMSAISRINSYLTNTKMPWEDEDIPETLVAVGTVECWVNREQGEGYRYEKVWSKIYPAQATTLHYCKVRERLLIGLDDGTVDQLKVSPRTKYAKFQQGATFKIHQQRVNGIYYQPLNRIMYTIGQDTCLITCDMSNYYKMNTTIHHQQLSTLLIDSANKRLFIGANQGHIFVYDYSSKTPSSLFTIITAEQGPIKSMTLDLVKNYLFTAGFELGMIAIFDIDKPGREKFTKQIACLDGKERPRAMVWVPSRMEILVGQGNGSVVFWDSLKGNPVYVLKADFEEITQMCYDDATRRLVTTSKGKNIKFWEIPKFWRDSKVVDREEEEKEIQRRVDNAVKVREITKKAALDSDQDDLRFWHKAYSESSGSDQDD